MAIHRVSPAADRRGYGHAVGILLLDHSAPAVPGDVLNARSFDYPVAYRYVEGLTVDRVFAGDPACAPLVVAAERELEAMGVGGISTNCGFLLRYQDAVARAVRVPVFLSSLLQLPLIAAGTGRTRPIGLVVANAAALRNDLLERSGVPAETPLVVADLADRLSSAAASSTSAANSTGTRWSGRRWRRRAGWWSGSPRSGRFFWSAPCCPPTPRRSSARPVGQPSTS